MEEKNEKTERIQDKLKRERDNAVDRAINNIAGISPCLFQQVIKYKKLPSNKKEICILCGNDALYEYSTQPKELFESKSKGYICSNHKNSMEFSCSNIHVPFIFAPCNFLVSLSSCFDYKNIQEVENPKTFKQEPIDIQKEDYNNYWDNRNCQSLYKIELKKLKPEIDKKCRICGEKAIYYADLKHPNFKGIYICERHSRMGCGCSENLPFPFAICQLLENNKKCVFYS